MKELKPFIKWPGGKRWLVSRFPDLFSDKSIDTYFEPFLGSAAVFAHVHFKRAVLSDANAALITTYAAIKEAPGDVGRILAAHHEKHSRAYFYKIRASIPDDPIEVAARFIYLNRTCFNGIYRVNQKGQFNVPIGTRRNVVRDDDDFEAWFHALRDCELVTSDFEPIIGRAKRSDLIYADPPYTVRHNLNSFRKYNESLFSWEDQIRLASALISAARRGVQIVVSNASHEAVSDLYPAGFYRRTIARNSSIAAASEKRGAYDELLLWTEGAIDEHVLS